MLQSLSWRWCSPRKHAGGLQTFAPWNPPHFMAALAVMLLGARVVLSFRSLRIPKEQCCLDVSKKTWMVTRGGWKSGGWRTLLPSPSLLSSVSTFSLALMGIKHSSRCMLLRRKMAESESSEVSVRHLDTFWFTKLKYERSVSVLLVSCGMSIPFSSLEVAPWAKCSRLTVSWFIGPHIHGRILTRHDETGRAGAGKWI